MNNQNLFANKVVAVTGGLSGIGFQIVKHLYDAGATVHILDVNNDEKAKEKIGTGEDLNYFAINVTFHNMRPLWISSAQLKKVPAMFTAS